MEEIGISIVSKSFNGEEFFHIIQHYKPLPGKKRKIFKKNGYKSHGYALITAKSRIHRAVKLWKGKFAFQSFDKCIEFLTKYYPDQVHLLNPDFENKSHDDATDNAPDTPKNRSDIPIAIPLTAPQNPLQDDIENKIIEIFELCYKHNSDLIQALWYTSIFHLNIFRFYEVICTIQSENAVRFARHSFTQEPALNADEFMMGVFLVPGYHYEEFVASRNYSIKKEFDQITYYELSPAEMEEITNPSFSINRILVLFGQKLLEKLYQPRETLQAVKNSDIVIRPKPKYSDSDTS